MDKYICRKCEYCYNKILNKRRHFSATIPQPLDTSPTKTNQKSPNPLSATGRLQFAFDVAQLLTLMNNLIVQNTAILQGFSNPVQPTHH